MLLEQQARATRRGKEHRASGSYAASCGTCGRRGSHAASSRSIRSRHAHGRGELHRVDAERKLLDFGQFEDSANLDDILSTIVPSTLQLYSCRTVVVV